MGYKFGNYSIEPDLHELRSGGELIAVEPQVFALLLYLVENRGRVVSKDELIEAIWDGRFVSDSAVSSRIKSARQAIGDNGKDQAAIRTVHGRGFRFVMDVEETTGAPSGARPAPEPISIMETPAAEAAPPPRRRIPWPIVAAAGLVAAVIAAAIVLLPGGERAAGNTRFAILPVENATGDADLDWTELGLMSLIQHALDQGAGIASVSPGVVVSLAEDLRLSGDNPLDLDPEFINKLERQNRATHIVLARLSGAPNERRLDYVVYAAGARGKDKFVVGKDPTLLASDLARDLVLMASGRRGLTSVDRTVSNDPFVLEAYARGRALQLEGKAKESRELFGVAANQEPENIWLRYEYAVSTRMLGEYEGAKDLLIDLLDDAQAKQDREAELAIVNALGITEMRLKDLTEALKHSRQAVALAEELGEHEKLGTALINVAIQENALGNLEAAEDALNRSRSAYADAGLPPPVSLLNTLALLKWDMKDLAAAETYLNEALEQLGDSPEKRSEGAIRKNLGELAEVRGHWDLAMDRYKDSLVIRRQMDDKRGLTSSLSALARLSIKLGRPADARRYADDLLAEVGDAAPSGDAAFANSIYGEAARLDGDAAASLEFHHKAKQLFEAVQSEGWSRREAIHIAMMDPSAQEAAAPEISRVLSWAKTNKSSELERDAHLALADLATKSGDFGTAEQHLSAALDIAKDAPSPEYEGIIAARLGQIALKRGDDAAAATYLGLANEAHPDNYEVLIFAAKREAAAGRLEHAAELARSAKNAAGANWSNEDDEFMQSLG